MSEWFHISLDVAIEDGAAIGATSYVYDDGSSSSRPASGVLIGNEDRFRLNLQVGQDFNPAWVYTGYVNSSDELCLVRDILPEPIRCLTPLQPSATHQMSLQK